MFDYDILFEFLPDEDKKSFMTWDNAEIIQRWGSIVATFVDVQGIEKIVIISVDEYEVRFKQKQRERKIKEIGI